MRRPLISLALSFCFFAGLPAADAVAQPAGICSSVQTQSYRTPSGGVRTSLAREDTVFMLDQIATDRSGAARLNMMDNTVITLGPQTDIVLDQFLYDPGSGVGDLVSSIAVGGLRFISGQMSSDSYLIQTPVATVGLRGTDVTVTVAPVTGATRLIVLVGEAWIRPRGLEAATQVTVGRMADVVSASAPPQIRPAAPIPGWARGELFDEEEFDVPY